MDCYDFDDYERLKLVLRKCYDRRKLRSANSFTNPRVNEIDDPNSLAKKFSECMELSTTQ